MSALSGLSAVFSQLMSGVARITVGWALVSLFGRVPDAKQGLLSSIGLASLVWVTAVISVIVPAIQDLLLSTVPRPAFIELSWLRLVVLVIALVVPLGIGLATVFVVDEQARPKGRALLFRVLRGYPYAAVLAATVVFIALLRLVRWVRSFQRGWNSEHLAIMVKPGRYPAVVDDVDEALHDAGLPVVRMRAPRVVELPPRLLALVGGGDGEIPDRLEAFEFDGLGILVYPSDIALLGRADLVARARAAIVRRLAFTDAYLTTAKESEQVEDRLTELSRRRHVSAADFHSIDETLTSLAVPYEDWATLYRLRLQVENETRLRATQKGASEG